MMNGKNLTNDSGSQEIIESVGGSSTETVINEGWGGTKRPILRYIPTIITPEGVGG